MLQNVETHINCFCYDKRDSIAELKELEKGETREANVVVHEIVFILEGAVSSVALNSGREQSVKAGEFVYLPAGSCLRYTALEDSAVLALRLPDHVQECHIFRRDKISAPLSDNVKQDGVYALTVNERMQYFLDGFMATYNDGLRCKHYLTLEVSRMLYLLHAYYPWQEYIKLFSSVVSPDMEFSEFVRRNNMKYKTIAEMASVLNLTPQQFSNRFRKVFGMAPLEWMQKEKAQLIYSDICKSGKSLKDIAYEYDFSAQTNFFRFCKKTFGDTPGNIRKSLLKDLAPVNK